MKEIQIQFSDEEIRHALTVIALAHAEAATLFRHFQRTEGLNDAETVY